MPSGITNVIEIIVFTAGADTFLGTRGPLIGPPIKTKEDILELVHARVSE
jgi:hypothetical protein